MTDLVDVPDGMAEAFEAMYRLGWTDGLPVVPATRDLVDEMIRGVGLAGDEVIARVPPLLGEATTERIAANAVMAGCRPEYMPVLTTAVRAMCAPQFNLTGIQTTGDSVGPGVILNGPVREEIGLNSAEGVAGPGYRANATIGRALRLILINLGGAVPGTTDRAMIGQPAKYGFCVGENEEQSPWVAYHESAGFTTGDSCVTVVPVLYTQFAWPLVLDADTVLSSMVDAMVTPSHSNPAYSAAPVTWIIPPANAHLLARAGYDRADVQQHLFDHARIPIREYPRSEHCQMWDFDIVVENDTILVTRSAQDVLIFVAGGDDYSGALYLGGWEARPVSMAIS